MTKAYVVGGAVALIGGAAVFQEPSDFYGYCPPRPDDVCEIKLTRPVEPAGGGRPISRVETVIASTSSSVMYSAIALNR